ncbi:hypothetical protein ONR57_12475 [Hoyosella sp. YIM 151337]|uniref:hypothetical protein n=1 Tax=Hoyosella sp. YIM 151337 TaxID=2992742 RepID=UPI0022369C1A|nr:hypothetical protein [Hoyosella sp. YIM 151337]MCW4354115.1 hypothetical protein [Hoyosella sp. YIM 151337]
MNRTRLAGSVRTAGSGAAVVMAAVVLAGCGTQAPPVEGAHLENSPGVPGLMQSSPAGEGREGGAETPGPGADGDVVVSAGEAGAVLVRLDGDVLTLIDVVPEPGWEQVKLEQDPGEIEVDFVRGADTVEVEIEIDDGRLDIEVDTKTPATDGERTYPLEGAGSVTIDVRAGFVSLISVDVADGWVASVDEEELREGEVEIDLRNSATGQTVEFDAEVDDGRLEVDRTYTSPLR